MSKRIGNYRFVKETVDIIAILDTTKMAKLHDDWCDLVCQGGTIDVTEDGFKNYCVTINGPSVTIPRDVGETSESTSQSFKLSRDTWESSFIETGLVEEFEPSHGRVKSTHALIGIMDKEKFANVVYLAGRNTDSKEYFSIHQYVQLDALSEDLRSRIKKELDDLDSKPQE